MIAIVARSDSLLEAGIGANKGQLGNVVGECISAADIAYNIRHNSNLGRGVIENLQEIERGLIDLLSALNSIDSAIVKYEDAKYRLKEL